MTFLSPIAGLLAAGLAVPALLLLYILKLRRRVVRVGSTMFWPGVREDLEVNTPFRRLRATPLLLLQMLAVLLLAAAIAEPVIDAGAETAAQTIVIVDRSASMSAAADPALPAGPTRLAAALAELDAIIERRAPARGGRSAGEIMIIGAAARAAIVSGYETRPAALRAAAATIEASDEEADLDAAMRLARAFVTTGAEAGGDVPDVILITDGGLRPPADGMPIVLPNARLDIRLVGGDGTEAGAAAIDNLGVVSIGARRGDEDPVTARVFARIANAGADATEVAVRFEVDGVPVAQRTVRVPAAGALGDAAGWRLGEATVGADVEAPEASTVRVVLGSRTGREGPDMLAADDQAAVRLPPAARPDIVLVAPAPGPRPTLRALIDALDPASVTLRTPGAWADEADRLTGGTDGAPDLVVLDGVDGGVLPPVPTLWLGGAPDGIEGTDPPTDGGRRILSWRRSHPVLRYVALDDIAYADFGAYGDPPPRSEILARGPDGPVMLEVPAAGARHVLVGFDLNRTNWSTDVGFAVFMQNVVGHLASTGRGQAGRSARAGETVAARVRPGAAPDAGVTISGPVELSVPVGPTGDVIVPGLPRSGVYAAAGLQSPGDEIAINVASAVETDLRPRPVVAVTAREASIGAAGREAPRDLWPWFVAVAVAVACLEWLLNMLRIRV